MYLALVLKLQSFPTFKSFLKSAAKYLIQLTLHVYIQQLARGSLLQYFLHNMKNP